MGSKLDAYIKQVNKKFATGDGNDIMGINLDYGSYERIPFSSPRLNYMLYGGMPRGAIVEFSGAEGSGKTTTALDVVANAQELFEYEHAESGDKGSPKTIFYADCENTLDVEWAEKLGVDMESMTLLKPNDQSAEEIFQIILDVIETGEVGLVVIDSLAVMVSEQAMGKDMTEATMAGISKALTTFSSKAISLARKHNCTIIGINQLRDKFNSPMGGTITPGGRAWKHNCSVRIEFRKGVPIDEKGEEKTMNYENPQGNIVNVKIQKTKICKPDRKVGQYTLTYNYGIDVAKDTIDLGMLYDLVVRAGSWFSLCDPETGEVLEDFRAQGMLNFIEMLKDEDVFDELLDAVNDKLAEPGQALGKILK